MLELDLEPVDGDGDALERADDDARRRRVADSESRPGLPSTMPIENGKKVVAAEHVVGIQVLALAVPGTYSDGGAPSRTIRCWHKLWRLSRFGFSAELPYDGVSDGEPHKSRCRCRARCRRAA